MSSAVEESLENLALFAELPFSTFTASKVLEQATSGANLGCFAALPFDQGGQQAESCKKVFSIVELTERILECLVPKDTLIARRTNIHFCGTVDGSTILQRRLFYEDDEAIEIRGTFDRADVLADREEDASWGPNATTIDVPLVRPNPVLLEEHDQYINCDPEFQPSTLSNETTFDLQTPLGKFAVTLQHKEACLYIDARFDSRTEARNQQGYLDISSLDMFLSQPSVPMTVDVHYIAKDGEKHRNTHLRPNSNNLPVEVTATVEVDAGVTLRVLLDLIKAVGEHQPDFSDRNTPHTTCEETLEKDWFPESEGRSLMLSDVLYNVYAMPWHAYYQEQGREERRETLQKMMGRVE